MNLPTGWTDELEWRYQQFSAVYPISRRVGGRVARCAFAGAMAGRPFSEHLQRMIAAVEQHTRSEQWQTLRLIPLMTTWLNQERWIQVLPVARRKIGASQREDNHEPL